LGMKLRSEGMKANNASINVTMTASLSAKESDGNPSAVRVARLIKNKGHEVDKRT